MADIRLRSNQRPLNDWKAYSKLIAIAFFFIVAGMLVYFRMNPASSTVPTVSFNPWLYILPAATLGLMGSGLLAAVMVDHSNPETLFFARVLFKGLLIFFVLAVLTVFLDFTAVNPITF